MIDLLSKLKRISKIFVSPLKRYGPDRDTIEHQRFLSIRMMQYNKE